MVREWIFAFFNQVKLHFWAYGRPFSNPISKEKATFGCFYVSGDTLLRVFKFKLTILLYHVIGYFLGIADPCGI